MSLFQFLRILWAHRWVTTATAVCTLIGAFVAILIVPPRYEGVSRVMLNTLKPDPVTGEVISGAGARTYIQTQTELIRDYEVAGKAVDQLNWASSPDIITQYQTSNTNGLDIRRWLAQRIIGNTAVKIVTGTNILEISYRASTPTEAKQMADALRNAYIAASLEARRTEAKRTADWYTAEAEKERALLNAADAAKTAYEKEHGIVMQADNVDIETARLQALSGAGAAPPAIVAPMAPMTSGSSAQLAQIDATLAQASKTLGPNHPQMVQLRAQRATVAQIASQEMAAARAAASAAASAANANASALRQAVDSQTAKVIAKREQIERLTQLQADVNMRREQYNKSMARIAQLRQEASIADPGIASLGDAVTPQKPSFPNKPLILGGAIGLGLALGILLSLLLELFGRRVRSVEDLQSAVDVPLLAIIEGSPEAKPQAGKPKRRFSKKRRDQPGALVNA
jgi:uncharacterized protein involved in exopolysaccharide biosynthesis